ncbi:DUF692 domain-containing protein [Chondromyces apiculatus]|uniref:Uncharacterized protein n=1 Tax=Chondromyces apiculatus DSM 436 TaxID=1192034 RepID=A0A017SW25_9BACT|nr:DUF692 domain-containing protein [Chondromyces apiculatus]EYF00496.1 Hypothetical protein CAP_0530 [Chondromyces apiculatus DSM 436]
MNADGKRSVTLDEIPFLGVGLGFRQDLKGAMLSNAHRIDFLELVTDQYMDKPPFKEEEAKALAEQFPLVMHGVDLSIGTDGPVDREYVGKMQKVAAWSRARWVSDHLCFTRVPGVSIGNLTPLAFTEEAAAVAIRNTREVMAAFDVPFLLENISYYFRVPPSRLSEAEFIQCVIRESGCYMLLDLANVQNNAINNGYDPFAFLNQMPLDRVVQIHLAGGYYHQGILLDTHSHRVPTDVLDLLAHVAPRLPNLKAVMIERDQEFPPIEELLEELDQVREVLASRWTPLHGRPAVTRPSGAERGGGVPSAPRAPAG